MKAEVISKSEKEHVVVLGGHEIGTSKARCDADLHANVINNALADERQSGYDDGYSEGYDSGQSDGHDDGYCDGYDRGYEVGLEAGQENE